METTDNSKGKMMGMTIGYVLKIFKESNQVIRHLDGLMKNASYTPLYGNTISIDLSHDLERPEQWLPEGIFRYYYKKGDNKTIRGITITYWNDEGIIEEPVLIGAIFNCAKPYEEREYWDIWRLWFKDGKVKPIDGELHDCSLEYEKIKHRILTAKVFAIPLASISSTKDIHNKIFKRLTE